MYQNYQYEVDPKDPLKPLFQGTFEKKVTVGGKERRYLVYIPKGARPSTAGVFILPENGKTADDLWRDSWWRMIADTEETKEKLIVFFLEPENGVWNTDEAYGKPDGDVAYIEQVYLAGAQRFKFCVHESKFYLTGCREGGVMANMAAMYNPAVWAGVVSVGGSEVHGGLPQGGGSGFLHQSGRLYRRNPSSGAEKGRDPDAGMGDRRSGSPDRDGQWHGGLLARVLRHHGNGAPDHARRDGICPHGGAALRTQSGKAGIPRLYERNRRRFRGLCQSAAASDLEGLPVPAAPLDELARAATCASQRTRWPTSVWNTITRGSAAGCANGMFTYRSRSRRSRKSRFRWYSRCTAIPAQAKSTRAIPSGTRLRISMALLWCILRQRRDRC